MEQDVHQAYRKFIVDQSGATAIEYALIGSLVFLAIVGSVQLFASKSTAMYDYIASNMR